MVVSLNMMFICNVIEHNNIIIMLQELALLAQVGVQDPVLISTLLHVNYFHCDHECSLCAYSYNNIVLARTLLSL